MPTEFQNEHKQEAARFLFSDFTSEKGHNASDEDHLHAGPVIRGITDMDRLEAWIEVKKDHPQRVAKADREALKQRVRELSVDAEIEFERASEIKAPSTDAEPEPAVADGGAVIEEDVDDGRELGPDQEWQEYADEAAFQSAKNDKRRTVWDLITTVEEAEDALEREFAKDVVPRHTVELLEERTEGLRGGVDE